MGQNVPVSRLEMSPVIMVALRVAGGGRILTVKDWSIVFWTSRPAWSPLLVLMIVVMIVAMIMVVVVMIVAMVVVWSWS